MKKLILILFAFSLIVGCKKEDDDGMTNEPGPTGPIELVNTGLEVLRGGVPEDWWFNAGPYDLFTTDTTAFGGMYASGITSDTTSENFGFWAQSTSDNIQVGKTLTLKVNIKAENVVGEGASIVIRGDDTIVPNGEAELFISTQGDVYIGGTHNWKEYRVTLEDEIDESIRSITVYVVLLPNTTGTIFFDDVTLEYD